MNAVQRPHHDETHRVRTQPSRSRVALDALLGAWLWFRPSRRVYLLAMAAMVLMTLIATLLSPSLWLHPLGPLSKNVPIAVLLWVLARGAP